MSFKTIADLRAQLGKASAPVDKAAYDAKMMHPFPPAPTVDRVVFILQHVAGKRVLEFGASGPMHDGIVKAAKSVLGVDLDDVGLGNLPGIGEPVDVIVCGEILEHLSNPGHFLARVRHHFPGIPVIITVPNAFAAAARAWALKGIENVNGDHVAWYTPKTLSVLLQRAGYQVGGLFRYGGEGPTAEGLIVVTE